MRTPRRGWVSASSCVRLGDYTSESLRAAGLHHNNRQAPPAQRVNRFGTDNGGLGIAYDLACFGLKCRPAATGDQRGGDKQELTDNAPHLTVIRPHRRERHRAPLGWASVPE